jgi:hypothetical protein
MNAIAAVKSFFGFATQSEPETRVMKGEMPKGTEKIRDAFFARPDDPNEKLTRLQERMQSGGS